MEAVAFEKKIWKWILKANNARLLAHKHIIINWSLLLIRKKEGWQTLHRANGMRVRKECLYLHSVASDCQKLFIILKIILKSLMKVYAY